MTTRNRLRPGLVDVPVGRHAVDGLTSTAQAAEIMKVSRASIIAVLARPITTGLADELSYVACGLQLDVEELTRDVSALNDLVRHVKEELKTRA